MEDLSQSMDILGIIFKAVTIGASVLCSMLGGLIFMIFGIKSLVKAFKKQVADLDALMHTLQEEYGGEVVESPNKTLRIPMEGAILYLTKDTIGGAHRASGEGHNRTNCTDIFIELDAELPRFWMRSRRGQEGGGSLLGLPRIKLGLPDFDAAFVIRGDKGSTAQLLTEAVREVASELRSAITSMERLWIITKPRPEGGTLLQIRVSRSILQIDAAAYIEQGKRLMHALQDAAEQLWVATAERYGLALKTADGLPQLNGHLNGVPIEIAARRNKCQQHRTQISLTHTGPAGMHVVHVDHDGPDAAPIKTGNPVLEMTVQIHGDDVEGILQMLGSEGCPDALLPIVHGYPGTAMTDQGTTIELPGWQVEALPELLEKLSALTQYLLAQEARTAAPPL